MPGGGNEDVTIRTDIRLTRTETTGNFTTLIKQKNRRSEKSVFENQFIPLPTMQLTTESSFGFFFP